MSLRKFNSQINRFLRLFPTVNCQSCTNLQFACGDGKCLNRNNDDNGVCDSKTDCSDGSDENRCGLGKQVGKYLK